DRRSRRLLRRERTTPGLRGRRERDRGDREERERARAPHFFSAGGAGGARIMNAIPLSAPGLVFTTSQPTVSATPSRRENAPRTRTTANDCASASSCC